MNVETQPNPAAALANIEYVSQATPMACALPAMEQENLAAGMFPFSI